MTPEWKDVFRYAVAMADKLGLGFGIASSPGWSEAGGPWVKPEQAMKKMVWTETIVPPGKEFTGTLSKPSSITGPFQGVPYREEIPLPSAKTKTPPQYYGDAAVIALSDASRRSAGSHAARHHVKRGRFQCRSAQRWRP